jgi:Undecaprenyl-phosphate glucose phosphotransferase
MKGLNMGAMGRRGIHLKDGHEPRLAAQMLGRLRLSYEVIALLAVLSDTCAVVVASMITGGAYHAVVFGHVKSLNQFFGVGAILAAATVALIKLKSLYTPDSLLAIRSQVKPLIIIWTGVLLFLLGICFTLKISDDLSRGWILSLAIAGPFLILCQRLLLKQMLTAVLQKGALKRRNVILITEDPRTASTGDEMIRAYDVAAIYSLPRDAESIRSLLKKLVSTARGSNISEVHIATDWTRWSDVKRTLSELRALPLPVRLIADSAAREILRYPYEKLYGAVTFEIQRAPLTPGERAAKRMFDIGVAMASLVAMAPLLLAIALAVWIDSPGPILFKQRRGGFNGRAFEILKFRTMYVLEDGPTVTQVSPLDHRVTSIGRWLRRSSVDELPQLINVLRGDMSLVGPRPHALTHDVQYSGLISNYPYRHHVKPGITGWAQINGLRGETPTISLMKKRVELDLWYVTNWSFWLDLRILFWTVLEVCRARNAF